MRHIIHIVGLAEAGKSTVVQALNEFLPPYEVLAIDDFRRRFEASTPEGESRAWRELWIAALKAEFSIIESGSMSENLQILLDRLWRAPGTNIFTIEGKVSTKTKKLSPNQIAEMWVKQLPEDFL